VTRVYAKTVRETSAIRAGVPGVVVAIATIAADAILQVVGVLDLDKPIGAIIGIVVGSIVSILRLLKEMEERPSVSASQLGPDTIVLRKGPS
jgi:hypothetical protein